MRAVLMRRCPYCAYCGRSLIDGRRDRRASLDHLVPRAAGGTNGTANLLLACHRCNCRKSDRPLAALRISPHRGEGVLRELASSPVTREALPAGHQFVH